MCHEMDEGGSDNPRAPDSAHADDARPARAFHTFRYNLWHPIAALVRTVPMDNTDCRRRLACVETLARDGAALLTRLTIGQSFLQTGRGKLDDLDGFAKNLESFGVPFASAQAPVVAGLEFIGGIALIVGLGTRAFSLVLGGIMAVALMTAHRGQLPGAFKLWPGDGEGLTDVVPWMYGLALLWLIAVGPGRVSLDRAVLAWWRRRRGAQLVAPTSVAG